MTRLICSESVPCGDGMRSTTTYDSDWCKHKVNKDYCKKCNVVEEKDYRLTHTDLRKLLNIPKDFKIINIGAGYPYMTRGVKISTRKTRRRKGGKST